MKRYTSTNTANGGYSPRRPDGHFEFNFTNAYMNSSGTDVNGDLDAAITNLFYMVNFVHDYYYNKLGFDEAAGNFQRENVSGLGLGNDEVQADVQDGWGTGTELLCRDNNNNPELCRNNANFYTPPDGGDSMYGKPRMQMYLFNNPINRDGDFDGDVIIHEYTHGLSTRLVGGLTACSRPRCSNNNVVLNGKQSGAMGEGWGDWFASSIYDDHIVGEYATGNTTTGIRKYALNNNQLTYKDICTGGVKDGPKTKCEEHDDGEIWSATLWDLRASFINQYGYDLGKQKVEQLVADSMKLSVSGNPSFLDMRNLIGAADMVDPQSKGINKGLIWAVFAGRGMGLSATTIDHNDQNPHETFDLPEFPLLKSSPFSPNGDGVKDTTTIYSSLSGTLYWTIMVKDSKGNIVKTCTGVGTTAKCIWDGKDTTGVIVPDGIYSYTLRVAQNPTDVKVLQSSGALMVDTIFPTGSIKISGINGWTKTSSVTLALSCTDNAGSGCVKMQLSNDGVFDTELWEPFSTSKAWTLTAGDGNKAVYARYIDKAGNRSSMLVDWITLDTTKPVITSVSDTPDPLKHHLGELSTISFNISDNLSGTCKAAVKIFNPKSVIVRTIIATNDPSCPTGGATGSVVWNGKNTAGTLVPAGKYTYKVQIADKALNWSFIKSGTVTVE